MASSPALAPARVAPSPPSGAALRVAAGADPAPTDVGLERQRQEELRNVTLLMLFRTVIATLLLIGIFSVIAGSEGLPDADPRFLKFVAGLLAVSYGATALYAVALARVGRPVLFAYAQTAVDLLLVTAVVHATGGAQSAFTFLYMLQVVAVALLPVRYGALGIAVASTGLFLVVSFFGYYGALPLVPGQVVQPSDLSRADLWTRLLLNAGAIFGVGGLGMLLAQQSQRAGERLARHQRYAGDLASLHENTIRCLPSGLVTVTPHGTITSINDAASEILGLGGANAIGLPIAARIPGLGAVLDELGPVGSVRRHEVDAVRPDGKVRRLGVSATPLSDHIGHVIGRVIHFQDLTELRRMEAQVERSERLASIGRLAAGIAHEIRNPLASISGSVEILRGLPGAEGDARQLIDIALREVDRLNGLITDLLEYARPRTEERQRLDLAEAAREIATAFEHEKRAAEIAIAVDAEPGVCIDGGAAQVRQVLWNLIHNAADSMPGGGTITLRIRRQERTGTGAEAVLAVSDNGVGIRSEDLERIFEPFFTNKARGTGLGLAIVSRIVESHRGTIETQSVPGLGTTFTLRFPAVEPGS